MASKTIPDEACFDRDLLPDGIRAAWWWLNWPLPIPLKHPKKRDDDFEDLDADHICALLLSAGSDGVWTISCGRMSTYNAPFLIEVNSLPPGLSLRTLLSPDARSVDFKLRTIQAPLARDIALFRFVLAAATWLRQRIVISSGGHIERHRRKQLVREYEAVLSEVKVIELRRAETSSVSRDGETTAVDWSCRWIVNGHWRNQYHPSTGRHELTFVEPYVKGPSDKPLRVPAHTVYQVDR